jgi:hypothetical protein
MPLPALDLGGSRAAFEIIRMLVRPSTGGDLGSQVPEGTPVGSERRDNRDGMSRR